MKPADQHNQEIHENLARWQRKPLLRAIYRRFYELIAGHLRRDVPGHVVELGSGIGNLKSVVPDCVCTDLFANPWIERVEDAYALKFGDGSVSNLVLFDVFHHLEYPGSALAEFRRVLAPGGRVILFEPAMSLLGLLVYGAFHHEPVALTQRITWFRPGGPQTPAAGYYSAQANATRVFCSNKYANRLRGWRRVATRRFSAISYVASGGYSGPQLYPAALLPLMTALDRACDLAPWVFATRLLVVLEKWSASDGGSNDCALESRKHRRDRPV